MGKVIFFYPVEVRNRTRKGLPAGRQRSACFDSNRGEENGSLSVAESRTLGPLRTVEFSESVASEIPSSLATKSSFATS